MSGDTLVLVIGVALVAVVLVPFYLRQRRVERRSAEARDEALRRGLDEPVSLHPVVSAEACIGTGNCLSVCPEETVLGLRHGQAVAISPARCIGHGLCERACPTEAIQLVFGSEKRGVEIPRVRENFETNVPGLYIIGELGGMGLIRNAFEQGRQCIEGIARLPRASKDVLDVIIVGCGPAGLSASVNCQHAGLRYLTLEKEDIGGTVRYYPRKKIVMTAPVKVPGYGKLAFREVRKEELIGIWEDMVRTTGIQVQTEETVGGIGREDGHFAVTGTRGTYRAKQVVLAIGRRGVPRKLGVPGESLPKVVYDIREPEVYRGDRLLVVGGGDSAVEAALALADQAGSQVTVSYRRNAFNRIKPANLARVEEAVRGGKIDILWSTEVARIETEAVAVRDEAGGERQIANDVVAIFAGGELPTRFLQACGVVMETKFGRP